MISQKSEEFLRSVDDDIPHLKLLKYNFYLTHDVGKAREIAPVMLNVAIQHELVGPYESIYRNLGVALEQTPEYKVLREKMSSEANKLINEASTHENTQNWQTLAQLYLKIAQIFLRFGQYQESFNYFVRLFKLRENIYEREAYFEEFALSTYYLQDYGELIRFHKLNLDEKFMTKSVDYCLVKDLKAIDINPKTSSTFKTLLDLKHENDRLIENRVLSFQDLGFLYSIIVLAYGSREEVATDVSWSSKLENQYLRRNYKTLLNVLAQERTAKRFHPIFYRHYDKCVQDIRRRVFLEVVSSFDRCPFALLEKMTGIKEGEALLMVKMNPSLTILQDPITSSLVMRKNSLPLYREVTNLYWKLNAKFKEEQRQALKKEDKFKMRGMMF